jgi:hypothetical protein
MTALEWFLSAILFTLYFGIMVTAGILTFTKGRWVLGIFGIFLPLLWLIGAILPARAGSQYATEREIESRPGYPQPR